MQNKLIKKAYDFFISKYPQYLEKIKEIEKITTNFSNHVYKFTLINGELFKVRIADNNEIISRKNEFIVLNLIKDPLVLFYDEQTGDAIYKWIVGRDLNKEEINEENLKKIFELASTYYQIIPNNDVLVHDHFDYFELAKKYLPKKYLKMYLNLVDKNKNIEKVLCHNDISLKNLIYFEKSIFLIDYEWARINTIYWDLGNFIRESQIGKEEIKCLSLISSLSYKTLLEFCFIASFYALQLTYSFNNQNTLSEYRERLLFYLSTYSDWIYETKESCHCR